MNKDEMIKDMAEIIDKTDEKCGNAGCFECEYVNIDRCVYILGATELYNAGYRKLADDEFVLKQDEVWEFRKDQAEVKFLKDKIKQETAREILQEILGCCDSCLKFCVFGHQELIDLDRLKKKVGELAKEKGIELED